MQNDTQHSHVNKLSIIVLSVVCFYCYAECRYAECLGTGAKMLRSRMTVSIETFNRVTLVIMPLNTMAFNKIALNIIKLRT
jgi:hypothetical protein